ncbi:MULTISPECIES: TrkH family potassium uptake protein [Borreliella]|uniref:Potassium uptake, TrkH family protein n=3 Tax=Borrelia bissettiae TaxID=64897 RepID=G0AMG1_BORBD|nr:MULTISPECIES: TrkH family potassium uptake protein [Borreliella]AEL18887.1 potassium uptake, TrkH family protein [Borreliella bissettiae DN127]MCD2401498.1 TrkH family potassium uptake protein [Borreliella bissettiae]WKC87454.1 TrkH family potassium uptake protein [Borreliella kurtenbachii]WKD00124.1 TrkH family potassium uptake protein [Borreliella bissettiae]WNY63156.1 TrkH family potassium uptake protein [Borreliella carolinensis]
MLKFEFSDRFLLFSYFVLIMFIGSLLLMLPISWQGDGKLAYIDALFTAVSAVSITGLITVKMEGFSTFGFILIMLLIQLGGLGFISITTFYLLIPKKKMNLTDARIIKQYSLSNIEYNPIRILKSILFITFSIEMIGLILILIFFKLRGVNISFLEALFTTISAFCNAGFSMHSESIYAWRDVPEAIVVVSILIICGGLGFMVYRDVKNTIKNKKKLSLHAKIVFSLSFFLIVIGAILFFFTEMHKLKAGYSMSTLIFNSIFYSISTRTAGFNYLDNSLISGRTQIISLPFMFIGGAPGSTAGGIKITTFFLIVLAVVKNQNGNGYIIGSYKVSIDSIRFALLFFARAIFILSFSFFMLLFFEGGSGKWKVIDLGYEVFSAFGTVGLSVGVTQDLSFLGKVIIIFTMFAGRIGLFSMAVFVSRKSRFEEFTRPRQDILVG